MTPNYVQTIRVDQFEKTIYTGCTDKKIRGFDYSTCLSEAPPAQLEPAKEIADHEQAVVTIDLDEKIVVSGSWDKTAKVFKKSTGGCAVTLKGHEAAVWSVKVLTERRQILSASADKFINLWNLKGQVVKQFSGHTDCVRALAYRGRV